MNATPHTIGRALMYPSQLALLASALKPGGTFLEIGTWSGVTAANLADRSPTTTIVSLDIFVKVVGCLRAWHQNRRPNQRLWLGTMRQLCEFCKPASFDAILVDADHRYPACKEDMLDAIQLLKPGGRLFCHDYKDDPRWRGVIQAVDELCATGKWKIVAQADSLVELGRA